MTLTKAKDDDNLNQDYERTIIIRKWGHRLRSRASAEQLRGICSKKLDPKSTLIINMAGVKAISPGFAHEVFGKLLIESFERNCKISFTCVSDEIRENMLAGIRAAIRSRDS